MNPITIDFGLILNVIITVFLVPMTANIYKINRELGELKTDIQNLKQFFTNLKKEN